MRVETKQKLILAAIITVTVIAAIATITAIAAAILVTSPATTSALAFLAKPFMFGSVGLTEFFHAIMALLGATVVGTGIFTAVKVTSL